MPALYVEFGSFPKICWIYFQLKSDTNVGSSNEDQCISVHLGCNSLDVYPADKCSRSQNRNTHFISITFYSASFFFLDYETSDLWCSKTVDTEKPYIVTRDKHILAKVLSLYARHFSGGEIW